MRTQVGAGFIPLWSCSRINTWFPHSALAQKLEQTSVQLEASRAVIQDLEEQLKVKDSLISEQRKTLNLLKVRMTSELQVRADW